MSELFRKSLRNHCPSLCSLSAYPVGLLSDRIGRLGLLVGGFLVYALTYIGFAFVYAPWQVWVLFALYGLHQGMSQGVLLALVADRVPSHLRGTAFGLINLATGVALLPASLLAGVLWQTISPKATFIVGSLFALFAIALLLATSKPEKLAQAIKSEEDDNRYDPKHC